MRTKNVFRIFDKNTQTYIVTGSYRKKHSWLVFPWEAIKQSNLQGDNLEVHEFESIPKRKFNLQKQEII